MQLVVVYATRLESRALVDTLSPPLNPPRIIHSTSSDAKGASRGVAEAGRGAVSFWLVSLDGYWGGAGAPPGLTTKPCQELADDRGPINGGSPTWF